MPKVLQTLLQEKRKKITKNNRKIREMQVVEMVEVEVSYLLAEVAVDMELRQPTIAN